MEHVLVDGLRIGYRSQGVGPPLLLLHGALCDSRVFGPQLDDLCDRFTVVAWDAPGCGSSSDPPDSFRLADYGDVLAAFVGRLGLDDPHVLGHSWGSGVALQLAQQHPSIPGSLILTGGYAGWAGSLPADEVERRRQTFLDIADSLPGGFDPTTVVGLFSEAMPSERRVELIRIMSETRAAGMRPMVEAFAEADLRDALGAIDVPVLVLHGADDLRSPMEVAEVLHRSIPGSQLVVMPGLGHEAFIESPSTFDAHVRAFVDDVADPGGSIGRR